MTLEEAQESVEVARRKAHAAARKMFPPGMTGMTSSIVDGARLTMIETMLMGLMAERSAYEGDFGMKAILEYRDYWEAIATEIEK